MDGRRGERTSEAVVTRAFQSSRGRILRRSLGLGSSSAASSSHSLGWSGKEVDVLLQAFTAQERKLRVRTFILPSFGLADGLGLRVDVSV